MYDPSDNELDEKCANELELNLLVLNFANKSLVQRSKFQNAKEILINDFKQQRLEEQEAEMARQIQREYEAQLLEQQQQEEQQQEQENGRIGEEYYDENEINNNGNNDNNDNDNNDYKVNEQAEEKDFEEEPGVMMGDEDQSERQRQLDEHQNQYDYSSENNVEPCNEEYEERKDSEVEIENEQYAQEEVKENDYIPNVFVQVPVDRSCSGSVHEEQITFKSRFSSPSCTPKSHSSNIPSPYAIAKYNSQRFDWNESVRSSPFIIPRTPPPLPPPQSLSATKKNIVSSKIIRDSRYSTAKAIEQQFSSSKIPLHKNIPQKGFYKGNNYFNASTRILGYKFDAEKKSPKIETKIPPCPSVMPSTPQTKQKLESLLLSKPVAQKSPKTPVLSRTPSVSEKTDTSNKIVKQEAEIAKKNDNDNIVSVSEVIHVQNNPLFKHHNEKLIKKLRSKIAILKAKLSSDVFVPENANETELLTILRDLESEKSLKESVEQAKMYFSFGVKGISKFTPLGKYAPDFANRVTQAIDDYETDFEKMVDQNQFPIVNTNNPTSSILLRTVHIFAKSINESIERKSTEHQTNPMVIPKFTTPSPPPPPPPAVVETTPITTIPKPIPIETENQTTVTTTVTNPISSKELEKEAKRQAFLNQKKQAQK